MFFMGPSDNLLCRFPHRAVPISNQALTFVCGARTLDETPENAKTQIFWMKYRFSHTQGYFIQFTSQWQLTEEKWAWLWANVTAQRGTMPALFRYRVSGVHRGHFGGWQSRESNLILALPNFTYRKLRDIWAAILQKSLTPCSPCSAEWMCCRAFQTLIYLKSHTDKKASANFCFLLQLAMSVNRRREDGFTHREIVRQVFVAKYQHLHSSVPH